MSVYSLVLWNDILGFHIQRKVSINQFLSIWPNDPWGLDQLNKINQSIDEIQLKIQEQICLLAAAARPPPPFPPAQ
mgnify:CR=1 FL=1